MCSKIATFTKKTVYWFSEHLLVWFSTPPSVLLKISISYWLLRSHTNFSSALVLLVPWIKRYNIQVHFCLKFGFLYTSRIMILLAFQVHYFIQFERRKSDGIDINTRWSKLHTSVYLSFSYNDPLWYTRSQCFVVKYKPFHFWYNGQNQHHLR